MIQRVLVDDAMAGVADDNQATHDDQQESIMNFLLLRKLKVPTAYNTTH